MRPIRRERENSTTPKNKSGVHIPAWGRGWLSFRIFGFAPASWDRVCLFFLVLRLPFLLGLGVVLPSPSFLHGVWPSS